MYPNNIDDFVTDEHFKKWVLNPTDEIEEYWSDFLENNPKSKKAASEARNMIINFHFTSEDVSEKYEDRILANVLQKSNPLEGVHHKTSPKSGKTSLSRPRFQQNWTWAIAAAIAIIVASVFVFTSVDSNDENAPISFMKQNPDGIKTTVKLPDGSIVNLNAHSMVKYTGGAQSGERRVIISGEAYFEVAKNKLRPFIIQVGAVEVTALGTAFNVNTFNPEKLEISLIEGKVMVESRSLEKAVLLLPGEQATYDQDNGDISKTNFDKNEVLAWKKKVLVFKRSTYPEVIEKLQRWYGVKIKTHGNVQPDKWAYTSEFEDQSLENVLTLMGFSQGFTFEINKKNVELKFD